MTTAPPRDAAGNVLRGSCCDTELRVVSMTSAGVQYACGCGKTTWTYLSDLSQLNAWATAIPESERAALDDCTERPGCISALHLTTCPEHR